MSEEKRSAYLVNAAKVVFALIVPLFLPLGSYSADNRFEILAFDNLLRNTELYDGHRVAVFGLVAYRFEDFNIYRSEFDMLGYGDRCIGLSGEKEIYSRRDMYNGRFGYVYGTVDAHMCGEGEICPSQCQSVGIKVEKIEPLDVMSGDDYFDLLAEAKNNGPSYERIGGDMEKDILSRMRDFEHAVISRKTQRVTQLLSPEYRGIAQQELKDSGSRLNWVLYASPFALSRYIEKELFYARDIIADIDAVSVAGKETEKNIAYACYCLERTCNYDEFDGVVFQSPPVHFMCLRAEKRAGEWYFDAGSMIE